MVGCCEQSLDLRLLQGLDAGHRGTAYGDGSHAGGVLDQFRGAARDEAEQRAQGGQALVAGSYGVAATLFEVAQEAACEVGINLFDGDLSGVGAVLLEQEAEQQQNGLAVTCLGAGAEVAFLDNVLEQEAADEGSEQVSAGHGVSPCLGWPGAA